MSWIYSFVSLAFQVPFSRYYGDGGFVLYWISSFLGMSALGLAVEALITLLTPRFIPYFLLLWIITNVSVAFCTWTSTLASLPILTHTAQSPSKCCQASSATVMQCHSTTSARLYGRSSSTQRTIVRCSLELCLA